MTLSVVLPSWLLPGDNTEPSPVRVVMSWDTRTPWEVHTVLRRGVVWGLSRDLLIDGLTGCVGIGDVQVRPAGWGEVELTLTGHLGAAETTAVLALPAAALHGFLARTQRVVPRDVWPRFDDHAAEVWAWVDAAKEWS